MSADLLRRAAAKMRENAEDAHPAPWTTSGRYSVESVHRCEPGHSCSAVADTGNLGGNDDYEIANARHIASWHPDVALAVADLLEAIADDRELDPYLTKRFDELAVAAARAYLGVDA